MPSEQTYGNQSRWMDGLPDPGVNKLDTGLNSIYWLDGQPYPVLYTQNKEGVVRSNGQTTISMTPSVTYGGQFLSTGQSNNISIYKNGVSASDVGSMKYWLDGNSFDLIKQLVSSGNPAKLVAASLERKPKITGYPSSVKVIDARMAQKRTSATGSGGGTSNIKVGDQSRWFNGLPVDGFLKESNP